jgi:hypothetical protein
MAAILEGLLIQLRALHQAGATRILSLHNARTEFCPVALPDTVAHPLGHTGDGVPSGNSSSRDSGTAAVPAELAAAEEDGVGREESGGAGAGPKAKEEDAAFEAFVAKVAQQGAHPMRLQTLSAHQVCVSVLRAQQYCRHAGVSPKRLKVEVEVQSFGPPEACAPIDMRGEENAHSCPVVLSPTRSTQSWAFESFAGADENVTLSCLADGNCTHGLRPCDFRRQHSR